MTPRSTASSRWATACGTWRLLEDWRSLSSASRLVRVPSDFVLPGRAACCPISRAVSLY
jgi:hypothetical protein